MAWDIRKTLSNLIEWIRPSRRFPSEIELEANDGSIRFRICNDIEFHRIVNYGGEKTFLDEFLSRLDPSDTVFDIGASVGLMTIHAARVVTEGSVVSFEPDPETREHLQHNVGLNKLDNVEFVDWAATDDRGSVTLFSDGADGFAPTIRKQRRKGAPSGEVVVETCSLDNAVGSGELPLPDILKIDIEGAELLCLQGATGLLEGTLGKRPRLVFVELHLDFLADFGASPADVRRILEDRRYTCVWESERGDQIHCCYEYERATSAPPGHDSVTSV